MAAGHGGADERPANGRQGARTPKSVATREKIMRAAAELMVERGGVEFQMGEVSARCGLSKGSLYYYFADRSALVRAIFDRSVDDLVDEVEAVVAAAPSAAASILGLVRALADAVRPGGPLMLAMVNRPERAGGAAAGLVEESRLSRVVDILTAQVERAKGEGLVRPEVNGRLAAAAVAGAFLVFEHVAPVGAGGGGVAGDAGAVGAGVGEALVREVVDLAFAGMGTERGRTLFSEALGGARAAS